MTCCIEGLAELALVRGDADACLRLARDLLALAARTARDVGRVRLVYDVERALAKLGEKSEAARWSAEIRQSLAGTTLEFGL